MAKKTLGYKVLNRTGRSLHKMDRWIVFERDIYNFEIRTSDVKARVKRIGGGYNGADEEFRKTVVRYWRKYGVHPKKVWYDLFCDGMDAYDPRFIPDPVWFHDIVPYFNCTLYSPAYADKGIYNRLLPDVKKPETVAKRTAGHYYNGDGERPVTREEAERLCAREEHLIVKPSGGTKGAGILFYDRDDKDSLRIPAIFDAMGGGFVAQRLVKQHPDLARLNPNTLNTVRVISFRFKGEVYILSALLRIGGKNARVDNVSAGGFACPVRLDGQLYDKAVNRRSEWVDETPNGIKLSTIRVPKKVVLREDSSDGRNLAEWERKCCRNR